MHSTIARPGGISKVLGPRLDRSVQVGFAPLGVESDVETEQPSEVRSLPDDGTEGLHAVVEAFVFPHH